MNNSDLGAGDEAPTTLGLALFVVGGIAFVSAIIAGMAGLTGPMMALFGTTLMAVAFALVCL